jgi:hypothetical protein
MKERKQYSKNLSRARFASSPSKGALSRMRPEPSAFRPGASRAGSSLPTKKVKTPSEATASDLLRNRNSSNCATASSNSKGRKIS